MHFQNPLYSLLAITFNMKPCSFFSILFCIFLIIIIWSRKTKGNNNYCDLKKINKNKVNSNFFLSVSKVCASLICSGGICPGVYVLGGKCPGGKCPGGIYVLGVSVWGIHVRGDYVLEPCPCPGELCPSTASEVFLFLLPNDTNFSELLFSSCTI